MSTADSQANASQLNDQGIALARSGQMQRAKALFEQAIRLRPDYAGAYNNLGNVFRRLGQLSDAEQAILRAIALDPFDAHLTCNLGQLYWQQGRYVESEKLLRNAVRVDGQSTDTHRALVGLLADLGRSSEQYEAAQRWIAAQPHSGEAHMELAKACHELRKPTETLQNYRRAIELEPNLAAAHANLAYMLADQGRCIEAREHYDTAYRLQGDARLRIVRDTMLPPIYDSHQHMLDSRQTLVDNLRTLDEEGIRLDTTQQIMPTLFYLAYHGQNDREIYQQLGRLGQAPRSIRIDPPRTRTNGKIRIGVLSRCLRDHTIGRLNHGWLEHLSRDFELVFLTVGVSDDFIGQAIRRRADKYVVVPGQLGVALRLIASQELDLLFYTDIGMDPFTYTLSYTRLAPVQCLTWGHPDTTGLSSMDYFISCRDGETDRSDDSYSEKLVRLSRLGVCYDPPPQQDRPAARAHFNFAPGEHIYCCPQTTFKLHCDFDDVLGNILRRDPQGRLMMLQSRHDYWQELIMRRFRRTIPDVLDRVEWLPALPRNDYLRLLAATDVLLDPLHFGGGNSSYEGLAVGTPIVTLPSEFLRGRLTYAMYRQMGLNNLIVNSPIEYVERCVQIGTNADEQYELRKEILARGDTIFRDRAIVGEFETFFRQAVGR